MHPIERLATTALVLTLVLLAWLAPSTPARADRVVNANEPIIISNDLQNTLREVTSSSDDGATTADLL